MLHYRTINAESNAPWAVFIHGAGGSIDTWKFQAEYFAAHFRVLLIDLRDHGKSQISSDEPKYYTFRLITNDILEVLNELNIKQAVFISLSFGSVLLQDLSMRSPGMVQAAIMAGAIFKGNISIRLFVMTARFFNRFLPYRVMYSLFSYLLMPKPSHQRSRRVYRLQARKIKPEAYLRWVSLYDEFFKLLKQFWNQKIDFPVLAVMGSADYVFLQPAKDFALKNSKVEVEIIPGAGHICNIDAADEFNQVGLNFLQKLRLFSNITVKPGSEIYPEN